MRKLCNIGEWHAARDPSGEGRTYYGSKEAQLLDSLLQFGSGLSQLGGEASW